MIAPDDEAGVAAAVAEAAMRRTPLAIVGGNTRAALGRPVEARETLSAARLTGITLYEPAELVLSVRAGTPVREVDALLAQRGQRLAFDPPDHRALFGVARGEPTIGAVAAANLAGPSRILAGAARDSLIGVRAVTGEGTVVKSGGRVMKNVTGYDLVKYLAGSYGTLAVLTEVTFKVLPVAETEATLAFAGLDATRAVALLSAALGSPFGVTAAAHVDQPSLTYIRIEGFAASVAARIDRLRALLTAYGSPEILRADASASVWKAVRDLDALVAPPNAPVWRISVKPSDAPAVVAAIRRAFPARALYDWGGGLVWVAGGEGADAGALVIRAAIAPLGGHATLVRAPEAVRRAVPVFQPLSEPVMALTRRLKSVFDPAGILNPGRMYAGV